MNPWPKNIRDNLEDIAKVFRTILRTRQDDIQEFENLNNVFVSGRKVGKVPTSRTDVDDTDRIGDVNYDSDYIYLAVPDGSGGLEWRIVPFNGVGIYGEMYFTNSTQTVTVASANVAYEVTTGFLEGTNSSFTFGGSHYLSPDVDGTYQVTWSMAIGTSGAGQAIEGGVMIDGTAQSNATSHTTVSASAAASSVAASGIFALSAGEQISLYVRNHDSGTNITVQHASVTVIRIDA